jgi:hypothetical protein
MDYLIGTTEFSSNACFECLVQGIKIASAW